jgi:hypothetical protein
MAQFLKAKLDVVVSENSDYSDPELKSNWDPFELTPQSAEQTIVRVDTGGGDVITTTGRFTAVTFVAVLNTDSTNYVTATYRTAGGAAVDQNVRIPAGGLLVLSDFTTANNLTLVANTAACVCKVIVAGT